MWATLLATLFRATALSFFIFVCASMHGFVLPNEKYSTETFALLTPYLTFLVLVLNVIYYLSANALQLAVSKVAHGALFCVNLALSLFVCILFWSMFLYDKGLLIADSRINVLPMWFHHAAHSAGVFINLIDAVLWKPSAPLFSSLVLLSFFAGGYIYLLEYLIRVQKFYAYPVLKDLSDHGRVVFYGVALFLSLLCFFTAYKCTNFVSPNKKVPRTKGKANTNRAAPAGSGETTTTGRPKKTRKSD